jgi:putative ABC transport system permease protein
MSPDEARHAALRKFGNVALVKEDTRAVWNLVWLEQLMADIRFGLRMLAKTPGFTAVAALTLALGIGANTYIFSVVDALLLRPIEFPDPARHVAIWERPPAAGARRCLSLRSSAVVAKFACRGSGRPSN